MVTDFQNSFTVKKPFNGLFSGTTWASWHQLIWILMKPEMIVWQWHQIDDILIICTSRQTDNHASASSLSFLQAGCSY